MFDPDCGGTLPKAGQIPSFILNHDRNMVIFPTTPYHAHAADGVHGVISNTTPSFWLPAVLVVPKTFPSLSTATLP
jgi:hypothetical protein